MDEELDVDVESAEDVPDIGVEATAGTYDEGFHDSVSYTVCTNRTWRILYLLRFINYALT